MKCDKCHLELIKILQISDNNGKAQFFKINVCFMMRVYCLYSVLSLVHGFPFIWFPGLLGCFSSWCHFKLCVDEADVWLIYFTTGEQFAYKCWLGIGICWNVHRIFPLFLKSGFWSADRFCILYSTSSCGFQAAWFFTAQHVCSDTTAVVHV